MKKNALILLVVFATCLGHATSRWTGLVDNQYQNAANWSDLVIPAAANDAMFDFMGINQTVDLGGGGFNIRNMIFNGGDYGLTNGTIGIQSDGAFTQIGSGNVFIGIDFNTSGTVGFVTTGPGPGGFTLGGAIGAQGHAYFCRRDACYVKFNASDVFFTNTLTTSSTASNNVGLFVGRTIFTGPGQLSDNENDTGRVIVGGDFFGGVTIGHYFHGNYYTDPAGAALILDDSQGAVANRLGTRRQLESYLAGLIEMRGNTAAPSLQASSRSLRLAGAGAKIRIQNAAGQPAHLAFDNLTYHTNAPDANVGNNATLVQYLVPAGSTLGASGAAGGRVIFSNAPALKNGLLRYSVVKDESSGAVTFATYDSTIDNGAPLGVTALASYDTTDLNTSNGVANVDVTGSVSLTNEVGFNAIRITPTAAGQALTMSDAGTLRLVEAQGLIFAGGHDYQITGTGSVVAESGSAYIYVNSNKFTINTPFVRKAGLAKAGDGLLAIEGPFANQTGEFLYVDKGSSGGDDMTINSLVPAAALVFSGPGQLALVGSADNSGFTNDFTIFGGRVILAKDSAALQGTALGSGAINLVGGELGARGYPATITNTVFLGIHGYAQRGEALVGDQPLTFTGPVLGVSLSGNENYQFHNFVTGAVVKITGPMSAFPAGTNTTMSSTLRFLGTGETIVEGNITDSPDPANPAPANMTTGVSKEGPGRLVLKGTNNYKGVTFLTGGFLCLESPSALGKGRLRIGQAGAYPRYNGIYTVLELGSGWTNGFTMPFGTGNGQLEFGGIAGQADGSAGFAAVTGTVNVNIGGNSPPNIAIWGGLGGGRFFYNAGPAAGPNPTYQAAFILGSPYCNGTLDFQNPIELYDRTRTIIALDGGAEVDGRITGTISSYTNAAAGIIKEGTGTLELAAANIYTGPTTIEEGRLLVTGSLAAGSTVTVKPGATLGGTGTIGGPVIVAGGTLAPGLSIGTLTINNTLTFSNNSQTRVEINAATGARDQVVGVSSVAYAGTLVVTTNHAGAVTNGQSFQIFSVSGSKTGNFDTIINQVPGVSAWTFNPSTGVLTATVPTVPTTPTNITYSVDGNSLVLSWPVNYTGWQLQSNAVSVASPTDWYPVAGSTGTNVVVIPISPNQTNVFYRLKY